MAKYHKITAEEHLKILASRRSVCPVPYKKISEKLGVPERSIRRYASKQPAELKLSRQRASMFDPFREEIEALLNKNAGKQSHNIKSAMQAFSEAYPGLKFGKTSFYDFVAKRCKLTRESSLARIPLEHARGEAQIDFCSATYYRRGRRIDGRQLTMIFPQSGATFIQLFPAENQQCLLEGLRNIFEFIGFAPKGIVFDNASTAVLVVGGRGQEAIPTKEYAEFAAWYGFETHFCNPASGWEKGSVERANEVMRKKYFSPPPRIDDEETFNEALLKRCLEDATKELHYLKQTPKAVLFELDREEGNPLPKQRFDCRQMLIRKTDKCAMIQVQKSRYSVSDKHSRKEVLVKIGAFKIEILEMTGEAICAHRRSYQVGSSTIDSLMYSDALKARPRAQIKQSNNEFSCEILSELKQAVSCERPAAREERLVDLLEARGTTTMPLGQCNNALLLFDLEAYQVDNGQRHDETMRQNSSLVQAASFRNTIHRGSHRQKNQRARFSARTARR